LALFFVYGLNMSLDNMGGRCGAGIQVIVLAHFDDHKLTFDQRGYANIVPQAG